MIEEKNTKISDVKHALLEDQTALIEEDKKEERIEEAPAAEPTETVEQKEVVEPEVAEAAPVESEPVTE